MAFRIVVEEFEAKFAPQGEQCGSGKIEYKVYRDGGCTLRAKLRALDRVAPDRPLALYINGALVGALERSRNNADYRADSRKGGRLPAVAAGDLAEIRAGETTVNRATFIAD